MSTIELTRDLTAFVTESPLNGFELEVCKYEEGDYYPIAPQRRFVGYTVTEAICDTLTASRLRLTWEEALAILEASGVPFVSSDDN